MPDQLGGVLPVDPDLALREDLSNLRGLLALSMIMTERRHEDEILHLLVTAVPALVRATPLGVHLVDDDAERWAATGGPLAATSARVDVQATLRRLGGADGPVRIRGTDWSWAFVLRSLGMRLGHLIVAADQPPTPAEQLLLRSLAQQAGTALANARLHARNRVANEELARTVDALKHKTAIHDRFTQVALTGGGEQGIVDALHQLTGLVACVEDQAGHLRAWAGTVDGASHRPCRHRPCRHGAVIWPCSGPGTPATPSASTDGC